MRANWIKFSWIRFISETNKAIRGKTLCNLIRPTSGNLPAAIPSIVELCRFIAQSTKNELTRRWTCRGFSRTWTRMTHLIYKWGKLLFRKLTQPSFPTSIPIVSLSSLREFVIRDMTHSDAPLRDSFQGNRSAHRASHRVNEMFLSLSGKKKKNGRRKLERISQKFQNRLIISYIYIWCV